MELDLQLFGGRGGSSGVATATSMQDTYGEMAEAKTTVSPQNSYYVPTGPEDEYVEISQGQNDVYLRTDMTGEDLAYALIEEGDKPSARKELRLSIRDFMRDVEEGSKIKDPTQRSSFWANRSDDKSFEVISKRGQEIMITPDSSMEDIKTVRSWISKGNVAYMREHNADGYTDTLGFTEATYADWGSRGTPEGARARIMTTVFSRDDDLEWYDDTVRSHFGVKRNW